MRRSPASFTLLLSSAFHFFHVFSHRFLSPSFLSLSLLLSPPITSFHFSPPCLSKCILLSFPFLLISSYSVYLSLFPFLLSPPFSIMSPSFLSSTSLFFYTSSSPPLMSSLLCLISFLLILSPCLLVFLSFPLPPQISFFPYLSSFPFFPLILLLTFSVFPRLLSSLAQPLLSSPLLSAHILLSCPLSSPLISSLLTRCFSPTAPYLGNQVLSYGQNFSFSLRLDRGVRHPSTNDVVLEGGGLRAAASLGDLRSIVPCGQKINYTFRSEHR